MEESAVKKPTRELPCLEAEAEGQLDKTGRGGSPHLCHVGQALPDPGPPKLGTELPGTCLKMAAVGLGAGSPSTAATQWTFCKCFCLFLKGWLGLEIWDFCSLGKRSTP